MAASQDEIVALVDRSGAVLGSSMRSVVRRSNLLHASTAVLVRNSDAMIYLHRRSDTKDWAPGFHDCAAGGVIQYGEQPEASAHRELAEELGIAGAVLHPLGLSLFEDDTTRCLEHCYQVTWDGPIVHADSEVAWGEWVTLSELDARFADPSWTFVPDTRKLLRRLASDDVGDYATLTHLGRRQNRPPGRS